VLLTLSLFIFSEQRVLLRARVGALYDQLG
jgi:hypothetical protein